MDQSAHRSAGAVDAVVEAPVETIEQTLNVKAATAIVGIIRTLGKAGEDKLLFVRDAVVVGVLEIPNIGSGADEEAAIIPKQRRGPWEVFGENGALVEVAVAVGVDQEANAPQPFVAPLGVIAHFDNKQAAI